MKTTEKGNVMMSVFIIIVIGIAAGIFFWRFESSKTMTSSQSQTLRESQMQKQPGELSKNGTSQQRIIFANVRVDRNPDALYLPLEGADFYSVNQDGTDVTELFSLTPEQLGIADSDTLINATDEPRFCTANEKMYIRTEPSGQQHLREIDLNGNVRELEFLSDPSSQYKNMDMLDGGLVLSPDCTKIVQDVAYFSDSDHGSAYNEIYLYDIDGKNKKVLFSQKKDSTNKVKEIMSWSKQNPNILYLTDYNWDRNGGGGGLYKMNITDGKIQQISQIPAGDNIYDISSDGTKVSTSNSDFSKSMLYDLTKGTKLEYSNDSNAFRLLSPDGSAVANEDPVCTGKEETAKCINDLYLFDEKQNKKLSAETNLLAWLSDNSILASKEKNTLLKINTTTGEINNIAKVDDNLVYIGVTK